MDQPFVLFHIAFEKVTNKHHLQYGYTFIQQSIPGQLLGFPVLLLHDLLLALKHTGDNFICAGRLKQIIMHTILQGCMKIIRPVIPCKQDNTQAGQRISKQAAQLQSVLFRHSDIAD